MRAMVRGSAFKIYSLAFGAKGSKFDISSGRGHRPGTQQIDLVLFFGRISGLFGRSGGGKAFVRIFQINLKVGKRLSEKWGHSKNIIVPRSAALARRPAVVHPPMGDSRMRQRIIYGSLGVFELASLPGRGIRASANTATGLIGSLRPGAQRNRPVTAKIDLPCPRALSPAPGYWK